jgi:hypothetical protein
MDAPSSELVYRNWQVAIPAINSKLLFFISKFSFRNCISISPLVICLKSRLNSFVPQAKVFLIIPQLAQSLEPVPQAQPHPQYVIIYQFLFALLLPSLNANISRNPFVSLQLFRNLPFFYSPASPNQG